MGNGVGVDSGVGSGNGVGSGSGSGVGNGVGNGDGDGDGDGNGGGRGNGERWRRGRTSCRLGVCLPLWRTFRATYGAGRGRARGGVTEAAPIGACTRPSDRKFSISRSTR